MKIVSIQLWKHVELFSEMNKNKQVEIKTQCWLEVDPHCWKRGLLVGN